ncbi:hypothetical protein [Streptomyces sp. NPDC056921]|uniref:hypothetical protein n=1 Tax=Streptomyces sp. NPDC056921 TaxID=3345966 RepID=UPI003631420F
MDLSQPHPPAELFSVCESGGWDARVARPVLRTPGEVQCDETIADLRSRLREAAIRAADLHGKLDAIATVTANLYYENLELKKKASVQGQRRIAALPASGPWLE